MVGEYINSVSQPDTYVTLISREYIHPMSNYSSEEYINPRIILKEKTSIREYMTLKSTYILVITSLKNTSILVIM